MPYTLIAITGTLILAAAAFYFLWRCDRLERRLRVLEEKDENKLVRAK